MSEKFKLEFLSLVFKNNNLDFRRIRSKILILSFKIYISKESFLRIKTNIEHFITRKFKNLIKQSIIYTEENSQGFLICIIYLSKRVDIKNWNTLLGKNFPIVFNQENCYFFGSKESNIFFFNLSIKILIKDLENDSNLYQNLLERYLAGQSNPAYKNLDSYNTKDIYAGNLVTCQEIYNNFNIKFEEGNSLLKFFSGLDDILKSIFKILKSKNNLVSKQILIEALAYTKIKNINQKESFGSDYYKQWCDIIDKYILPTWKECFFSLNFFTQRFKYFVLDCAPNFLSYAKGFETLFQKTNLSTNIAHIKEYYLDFEKSLNLLCKTKYKIEELNFENFSLDINIFLLVNFYRDILGESLGEWVVKEIINLFNSDLDQSYSNKDIFNIENKDTFLKYSYEDNLGNNLIYKNLVCKILTENFSNYLKFCLNLLQIEDKLDENIISNFVKNHNKKIIKSFYTKFKNLYNREEFSLLINENSERIIKFDLDKKYWNFNFDNVPTKDLGEIFIDILQATLFIEIITIQKKGKRQNYIKMNPFLKEFGSKNSNFKLINLPMIVEPNNWIIENCKLAESKFTKNPIMDKNILKSGGYLLNYCTDIQSGISLFEENHGGYKISYNSCESINYLAKQKYYFNNILLDYQLHNSKNFFKFLFSYLNLIPESNIFNTNLDSVMYFENNALIIRSFESYRNIKISLEKCEIDVKTIYNKYMYRIKEFFSHLLIMNLFKNYTVYFPWIFDSRFRMYSSTCGHIHIQSNSYVKAHVEMLPRGLYILSTVNFDSKTYLDQINSFKKRAIIAKKSFNYYKFIAKIDSTVFEFDAHVSMIAICCALTGDLESLIMAKIFKYKNGYKNSADFYLNMSEYFYNHVNNKLYCEEYSFFKSIDHKFSQAYYQIFFLANQKTTQNRDFFKKICMPYIYSESVFSRANKYLEFCKNNLNKEIKNIQNKYKCSKKLIDIFIKKISYILARNFEEVFSYLYPNIHKLKTIIEKKVSKSSLLKRSRGIHLYIGCKYSQSFIPYLCEYKYITKKYKAKMKKGILLPMYKQKYTFKNKISIRKSSKSTLVHLIHRLDAQILEEVVLNFKKCKFPIATAHDCIYTVYQHADFAKDSFYKSFVNLLLTENPLEEFLKKNLYEDEYLSEDITNFLKESNLKKNDVLLKIKNGILELDEDILEP